MHTHLPGYYELQQQLNTTAVEEAWKAFDTQRHRYVSIKLFHIPPSAPADLLPRFIQDIKITATLRHSHIVPLLDCHIMPSDDGSYDIAVVTEYVEGPTLADYLASTVHKGNFPSGQEIIAFFVPLAMALDYAHQRGALHGGIKPRSILLDRHYTSSFSAGEPRLTDFGLQLLHPLHALPMEDVAYISPEAARGYRGTDRSDLYSLGIILYELCTGVLPFQGKTPTEVISQHIYISPGSPVLVNPHLLPAATAVIMRSLDKDPAARFPTAQAMVTALAKAFNVPVPEMVSRSGPPSLSGITPSISLSYLNLANVGPNPQDSMNSPTYLSPPPLLRRQEPSSSPAVSNPSLPASPAPALTASAPHIPGAPPVATPVLSPSQITSAPPAPAAPTPPIASTQPVPPKTATPVPFRGRRWPYILLSGLVIIGLLGSALWTIFLLHNNSTTSGKPIVGYAFFTSSGLISLSSSQGIVDGLQIALDNLPPAQSGEHYYAWLLPDNNNNPEVSPILLGMLPDRGGKVLLTYPGNAFHDDLLAQYSRLRITEESASSQPTNPSLDPQTWRYYAAFSQVPNPADTVNHFSLLDHLRHLLALDPKLKGVGLTGGLDIWLFRNTEKILEWAGSARDAQQGGGADLTHRQVIRILDYLDGSQYISTEGLPPADQQLLVDPTIARVALLEFDVQQQEPPGYLKHIGNHLRELIECPGVTEEQRALAIEINAAIDNVQGWLQAVHHDASKLAKMSNAQLLQPDAAALLNDMFVQASYAFSGQIDPNTDQVKPGVVQIHYNSQRLATFEITACTGKGTNPCV
jgi:serine/threonine protein kinase